MTEQTELATITIRLPKKDYKELRRAAADAMMPLDEYIGNALQLYQYLRRQVTTGGREVYIGKDSIIDQMVTVR